MWKRYLKIGRTERLRFPGQKAGISLKRPEKIVCVPITMNGNKTSCNISMSIQALTNHFCRGRFVRLPKIWVSLYLVLKKSSSNLKNYIEKRKGKDVLLLHLLQPNRCFLTILLRSARKE